MQPVIAASGQPDTCPDDAIWKELRTQLGTRSFEHWFHRKTTVSVHDDELTIGVASPFLLSWMQKQFRAPVLKAAHVLLGTSARVVFEVDSQASIKSPQNDDSERGNQGKANSAQHAASAKAVERSPAVSGSGRRCAELADFVVGSCNELAWTAARQVCESPGTRFNPLYIHGGVGTGKTHLLEGIYRSVRRQFPALKALYLTSEAFANCFTEALRNHTLPSFRQRFRNVDVLLVDDVDFLDSKRVIQEEFLHTFMQLESHSRQIVLTADRHPRLLAKLSDELTSRFFSGLVCRVESPELDTRLQIVKRKAKRMDVDFAPEALMFVARRFKNNVREIEGALNCLQTYSTMTEKRITVAVARQVLADLERDCIRIVRLSDIERAVCRLFGMRPADLKSPRRSRTVSHPRMLAMFLARKLTQAAYSEIGQYFGGRNHSTVVSAEKRVQNWLTEQSTIRVAAQTWTVDDVLENIERQLQAG